MWEELYEAHYRELIAYGAHISGSRELAEDLVQETFIKALMNTETVEDLSPSKRRAWLYRTFKNLFFDRCRRAALENEYEQSLRPECSEDRGILEIENAMLLQSINPRDRAIFQLRYFDGYTAEEIAGMMNLPSGTIRSRLSRSRKYLKEQLQPNGGK
ncbi:RNA polymerase sigma factor [Acidaminobacterium chupaoyuni]